MDRKQLINQIFTKKSFLCVGLDTDIKKIPEHLKESDDPIFDFNKAIIDATAPYCVAYKPNMAFYESLGVKGIIAFEETVEYLKKEYPEHFIIADAKRGYFDYAFRVTGATPSATLMIGDNFQTDILGAKGAGLDVMWFNPVPETNKATEAVDYEIHDLREIGRASCRERV